MFRVGVRRDSLKPDGTPGLDDIGPDLFASTGVSRGVPARRRAGGGDGTRAPTLRAAA
jgi:hypothetical protein